MNKIPVWFYIVAILALLWNVIGAAAVVMNFMMTAEQIAALPPEQQQLYADSPAWSSYASLLAVIAGSLGCIALLLKKTWAQHLFIASLIGLIVQNIGIFVVVDAVAVVGITPLIMQGIVFLIAIGLLLLARHAEKREWLS